MTTSPSRLLTCLLPMSLALGAFTTTASAEELQFAPPSLTKEIDAAASNAESSPPSAAATPATPVAPQPQLPYPQPNIRTPQYQQPAYQAQIPQYRQPPQYGQPQYRQPPPQGQYPQTAYPPQGYPQPQPGYGYPPPQQPYGYHPQPYGYAQPMPYGRPPNYRTSPWNSSPFSNAPWNVGPWSNGPWGGNRGGFGPFSNGGPADWFTPDPRDGLANMWDDMINAPHDMGEMPGGWSFPSISVPNPVDVGDQLGEVGNEAAKEVPNFIQEVPNMFSIN